MRSLIPAVLLVAACSKPPPAGPAVEAPPPGSLFSPPRADWPCTLSVPDASGAPHVLTTYTYGERERCAIPLELVTKGLVGCAADLEYEGEHVLNGGFQWDGPAHLAGETVILSGRQVDVNRADGSLRLRMRLDERGRPVYVETFDVTVQQRPQTSTELVWRGERLVEINTRNETMVIPATLQYDCK